ncbi:MAG: ABC transporter permease, partial [Acholeplasmataceae bacterium]
MLKVFKYLKWYHWLFLLIMVGFIYLQVRMDIRLVEKMGDIIETIAIGITNNVNVTSDIISDGLIMLLVSFLSISSTIVASFIATRIGTKISSVLRHEVYHHVQDFSLAEVNIFSTPSLITRTTNDVQQVQMALIIMLRLLVTAPITAITAILKIANLDFTLTWVVAIAVLAIMILIIIIFSLVNKQFAVIQTQTDNLNQVTRETLTGIRVVRAHNAEDAQAGKFDVVNEKLTKTQIFVNTAFSFMNPGMTIVMNGLNL